MPCPAMITTVSSGRSMCRRSMPGRRARSVHLTTIHPDVAVLADRDEDVAGLPLLGRIGVGTSHDDAGLFDEGRRDDEEDEQVQHEVQHRREVDAVVFAALGCDGVTALDSPRLAGSFSAC